MDNSAEAWNKDHPVGTWVGFWLKRRTHLSMGTLQTRTPAFTSGTEAFVHLDGFDAPVPVGHLRWLRRDELPTRKREGALPEHCKNGNSWDWADRCW